MNITAWLSKLTDFASLGQFIVTGGPGILLAAAILFAVNGCPSSPSDRRVELRKVKSEIEEIQESAAFQAEEKDYASKQSELEQVSTERERLMKQLTPLKADLKGFEAQGKLVSPQQNAKLEGLESKAATLRESIDTKSKELKELELERKFDDERQKLAKLQKKKTTLKEGLKPLENLLTGTLNVMIAVVLAGWIIGTLLGPINRIAFLQLVRVKPGVLRQEDVNSGKSDHGTEGNPPLSVSKKIWDEITTEVSQHRSPFFVGRGLITASEWDNLVQSYYRWTEASMNLVLPTVAWSIVLATTGKDRNPIWFGLGAVAAILLVRLARRSYKTYKTQVAAFVAGKLVELYLAEIATPRKELIKCKAKFDATAEKLKEKKKKLKKVKKQLEQCTMERAVEKKCARAKKRPCPGLDELVITVTSILKPLIQSNS